MSFCHISNRNRDHGQSARYLHATTEKLRCYCQFWLANNLCAPWMYVHPLQHAIETDTLFYPLALIAVNHQGNNLSFNCHQYKLS